MDERAATRSTASAVVLAAVVVGGAVSRLRFGFEWDVATPGLYEIRARATDSRGRVQPNRGRNAVHAVSVTVAS